MAQLRVGEPTDSEAFSAKYHISAHAMRLHSVLRDDWWGRCLRWSHIVGQVGGCPEVSNWGNALGRPMAASWQPKYHTSSYRWEEVEARDPFGRWGRLTPTARLPSERQQTKETNLADHQQVAGTDGP